MNNYELETEIFGDWIQRQFITLPAPGVWPVLLHCTAGKDRTGVAVALILRNLGLPDVAIVEEYLQMKHWCLSAVFHAAGRAAGDSCPRRLM